MFRVNFPLSTRTPGLDIFDTASLYRMRDIDPTLQMLNQDNGAFHRALDAWSRKPDTIQPLYHFVEDDILPASTQINAAAGYAVGITTLVVDDARLFIVNSAITVTRTLESMRVTAVTYSTNTIEVVRGWNGTTAVALVDNEILMATVAHLPEGADANEGTGRVPEKEQYNYTFFYSESVKVTDVQRSAAMIPNVNGTPGTLEWEVMQKMFEVKRKLNKALIFDHRGTTTTADGTIYSGQGFVHYIEQNVLNLGEQNETLTWPNLSSWLDIMFEPTASSSEKIGFVGNWLFAALQRMSRDMVAPTEKYFHPVLQVDMIDITTESGNTVKFARDKWGFSTTDGLGGWGIVVDMGHAWLRQYNDWPMTWRKEIQASVSHIRQDEIFGSASLELHHPEVHGYIRQAGQPIVE